MHSTPPSTSQNRTAFALLHSKHFLPLFLFSMRLVFEHGSQIWRGLSSGD